MNWCLQSAILINDRLSNGRVWSCIVKTGPWKFVLEYPWGKTRHRGYVYASGTNKIHSVVLCGFGQNGEVFSRRRSAYERKSELFLTPTCSSKFLISLFYFCCYLCAVTVSQMTKRQQKTHRPHQATASNALRWMLQELNDGRVSCNCVVRFQMRRAE